MEQRKQHRNFDKRIIDKTPYVNRKMILLDLVYF